MRHAIPYAPAGSTCTCPLQSCGGIVPHADCPEHGPARNPALEWHQAGGELCNRRARYDIGLDVLTEEIEDARRNLRTVAAELVAVAQDVTDAVDVGDQAATLRHARRALDAAAAVFACTSTLHGRREAARYLGKVLG